MQIYFGIFMDNWESKTIVFVIFAVLAIGSIAPIVRLIIDSY